MVTLLNECIREGAINKMIEKLKPFSCAPRSVGYWTTFSPEMNKAEGRGGYDAWTISALYGGIGVDSYTTVNCVKFRVLPPLPRWAPSISVSLRTLTADCSVGNPSSPDQRLFIFSNIYTCPHRSCRLSLPKIIDARRSSPHRLDGK